MVVVPTTQLTNYNDRLGDTTRTAFPIIAANGGVFIGRLTHIGINDDQDYFVIDVAGGTRDGSGSLESTDTLSVNFQVSGLAGTDLFGVSYATASYDSLTASGMPSPVNFSKFIFSPSSTGSDSIQPLRWTNPTTADALIIMVDSYNFNDDRNFDYTLTLGATSSGGGGTGGGGTGGGGTGGGGAGATTVDLSASISNLRLGGGINTNFPTTPPGGLFTVDVTFSNAGSTATGGGYFGYYISTDPIITTSDRLLVWGSLLDAIPANGSRTSTIQQQVPTDLAPGTYYFGVVSDYTNLVSETNENNNASNGIAFTVASSELSTVIGNVRFGSGSKSGGAAIAPGGNLLTDVTLANGGNLAATGFKVGYYLSTDAVLTTSDVLIDYASFPYASAVANGSHFWGQSLVIPNAIQPGVYYFGVIADPENTVREGNEINNGSNLARIVVAGNHFQSPVSKLAGFGASSSAGGWTSDNTFNRTLADINGDGLADIVGFGSAGVVASIATGGGNFGAALLRSASFGTSPASGGWTSDNLYHRELADVNGDGMADIVGFGGKGVFVSLASGAGNFGATSWTSSNFGSSPEGGGWASNDRFPRMLADVNGDGRADIVGFGGQGVFVALSTGGNAFGPMTLKLASFGANPSAGGWDSFDRYPRELADVNGDGMADIVGFGTSGVYVSLATGGGNFGPMALKLAAFGAGAAAGSWSSDTLYHRELADVNGDGRADIVGFGGTATFVALGRSDGSFLPPSADLASFGAAPSAGGWSNQDLFPRHLMDVNGDQSADIVGFGAAGVTVAMSNDYFFV